jgi:tRNA A37 threonylcarbamoyladenosine synthetase subunit TsaC/SUA5/YrdC
MIKWERGQEKNEYYPNSNLASTSAPTSTSTSIQLKNQQQIQHIDADFYEECDGGSAAAADGQQQRSDLVLGTATALYVWRVGETREIEE